MENSEELEKPQNAKVIYNKLLEFLKSTTNIEGDKKVYYNREQDFKRSVIP